MLNKGLTVGIILIFVSVSIVPSTATIDVQQSVLPTSSGNTLYVGGSGPGNYTSIQDAIDNASSGDTVYVFNGTYYERVKLNKAIDLIGENKETTVIDGERKDDVVYVSADYVTISGFTIQNSGNKHSDDGIYVHACIYVKILDNIISENEAGIDLHYSSKNTITNNIIKDNSRFGIGIGGRCDNNFIYGNTISKSGWAISAGSIFENHHHNISGNTINYNTVGIYLTGSSDNIISGNTIIGNRYPGIDLSSYSSNNIITGNYISLNAWGIRVGFSKNTYISNNILIRNWYGIWIESVTDTTVMRNIIRDHISWGIVLFLYYPTSNIQILQNNFINNNPDASFYYDSYHLSDKFNINWDGNYWNKSRWLPKPIFGIKEIWIFNEFLIPFPWINIDWHPAREPYDIPEV